MAVLVYLSTEKDILNYTADVHLNGSIEIEVKAGFLKLCCGAPIHGIPEKIEQFFW